jgi:hypothetical protein
MTALVTVFLFGFVFFLFFQQGGEFIRPFAVGRNGGLHGGG